MPGFTYQTIAPNGQRTRGSATATDESALRHELEARGLTVLELREADERRIAALARPSRASIADAMRALAALLPAGLPLVRALDAAAATSPAALARRLLDIRARVERGESLASAFGAQPGILSPAAIGVIRAGERAGDLDAAFERLADQLERDGALRDRLISAAIYPALLTIVGGAAVLVLLFFVLPRFADLLGGTGARLPASTSLLLAAATAAKTYWWTFPLVAATAAAGAAWLRFSNDGRVVWARVLLAAPFVRAFRRDLLGARAARLIAILLHGGASLLSALDDAAASMDDPLARDALARVRERVRTGSPLHAALAVEPVFPPLLSSLVSTGEEAGRLHDFLARGASLFEQRTERSAQRLVALAEPAMIVLFGAIVGLVALSLLQAIYGVNPAALR